MSFCEKALKKLTFLDLSGVKRLNDFVTCSKTYRYRARNWVNFSTRKISDRDLHQELMLQLFLAIVILVSSTRGSESSVPATGHWQNSYADGDVHGELVTHGLHTEKLPDMSSTHFPVHELKGNVTAVYALLDRVVHGSSKHFVLEISDHCQTVIKKKKPCFIMNDAGNF